MGFVGLGSVSCSLNTTPLDDLSDLRIRLLPLNIELCDTPVEGALSIKDAAQGVAVCKTGLLINGLDVVCTAGSVDDFGNDEFEFSPMFDKLGTVVVLVKGICFSNLIGCVCNSVLDWASFVGVTADKLPSNDGLLEAKLFNFKLDCSSCTLNVVSLFPLFRAATMTFFSFFTFSSLLIFDLALFEDFKLEDTAFLTTSISLVFK